MMYWKRVDVRGRTTTVESYSHEHTVEGAVEITEKEFNDFILTLPPAQLTPDPDAELAGAIQAATTLAELKSALLGETRAGAVKGRSI